MLYLLSFVTTIFVIVACAGVAYYNLMGAPALSLTMSKMNTD